MIKIIVALILAVLPIGYVEAVPEEPLPEPTPVNSPVPTPTPEIHQEFSSKASWYGNKICEGRTVCRTASGAIFDENLHTTACSSRYQLGETLRVTNTNPKSNGVFNSVLVVCNDRGVFEQFGREVDLSKAAFETLAPLSRGIIQVRIERIKS